MKRLVHAVAAALLLSTSGLAQARECIYDPETGWDPNATWEDSWTSPSGLRTYTLEAPCLVFLGIEFSYTAKITLDPSCPVTSTLVAGYWAITDEAGYEDENQVWQTVETTTDRGGDTSWIWVTDRVWQQTITKAYGGVELNHIIKFEFDDFGGDCGASGMRWTRDAHVLGLTIDPYPPIEISPTAPVTPPSGQLTFTAALGSAHGFVWSLATNASGGTIDATTGVYTAGPVGDVTDVVQVTDSAANVATATVSVTQAVAISPATTTLDSNTELTFTAAGGSGEGFVWTLATNASGGTIDAGTGAYTAGAAGNVTDVVQVVDSLGNVAQATVSVVAAAPPPPAPEGPPRGRGGCATGGAGTSLALGFAALLALRRRRPRVER